MTQLAVMLIFAVLLWTSVMALNCERYLNFPNHTMCICPAMNCPGYEIINVGFNSDEKVRMVRIHNDLRQSLVKGMVQGEPRALSMKNMVWDEELAAIAQRHAEQCYFQHDEMRDVPRFRVGQNIYEEAYFDDVINDLRPNIIKIAMTWWNEVYKPGFSPKYIKPFVFCKDIGDYTQMAWADTSAIGCGFITYRAHKNELVKFVVCNYGPAGNVVGGTMYPVAEK